MCNIILCDLLFLVTFVEARPRQTDRRSATHNAASCRKGRIITMKSTLADPDSPIGGNSPYLPPLLPSSSFSLPSPSLSLPPLRSRPLKYS